MSVCNPLLYSVRYQEHLLASANNNNNNNNNNSSQKIWNPAFTESAHERRTKELLLDHQTRLALLAANMGGLLPVPLPTQPKAIPTHMVPQVSIFV